MHVLLMSYEFPPLGGGGGRVVHGLARRLLDKGHKVDLVTMKWPDKAPICEEPGLTLHPVPCLRLRPDRCSAAELATYIPAALWITWRLFRRRRFDAVHAHFILPDAFVLFVLRSLGMPRFLVTAHGSDVPGYNPDRFRRLHRLLAPLWRRIVRSADAVVCPSQTLEALVKEQLPEARTEVIANGFEPSQLDGAAQRQRRILVLARLVPRKGAQHVVEAFTRLDTDFELHVAGDGPMLPVLEERAAADERVVLHGWIDSEDPQLARLLETAAIFVLFSEAENFPVSLLEAMAAGLAIVTTRGTGCEDVVGDAALLVEPGDVEGLRAALARLVAEPALVERLGRAARQRLVKNFTWDEIAGRYLRLYERLDTARDDAEANSKGAEPSARRVA